MREVAPCKILGKQLGLLHLTDGHTRQKRERVSQGQQARKEESPTYRMTPQLCLRLTLPRALIFLRLIRREHSQYSVPRCGLARTSYVPRPPAQWPVCVPCYALTHIRALLCACSSEDPRWTAADVALAQCHYLISSVSTSQPLPALPQPAARPNEAYYDIGPAGLYPITPADVY